MNVGVRPLVNGGNYVVQDEWWKGRAERGKGLVGPISYGRSVT